MTKKQREKLDEQAAEYERKNREREEANLALVKSVTNAANEIAAYYKNASNSIINIYYMVKPLIEKELRKCH